MLKNDARAYALNLRKKLLPDGKIIDDIFSSGILDKYNKIGIYYPIGTEINILDLLIKYPNKRFYLPKTDDEIEFIEYKEGDSLFNGPFNTKEPAGIAIARDEIECFLIPCVAINKDKQRLGYGKGYYDRYLNDYKGLKIGICNLELSSLEFEASSYDLYLDLIFTD